MKTLYTVSAIAHGGRAGKVESSDGVLDLDNSKQFFAAGYAACFESALRLVAGNQEKDLGDASIMANVGLGRDSSGNFGLAVELVGRTPNLPREEAKALMAEAHQVCPYSRATRGNVDVGLTVED